MKLLHLIDLLLSIVGMDLKREAFRASHGIYPFYLLMVGQFTELGDGL